ncbi:MAG: hypothetical protein EPN38_10580 [Rhodanobacteraceae bacterium]|nr:MAG: hypothetical protein EPN38_10580 [Rhodanobacteraceae bacterium]
MEPTDHHPSRDFTRTRWSLVRRLHTPRTDEARDALAELAVRYWYPVYAYVRRCGHAPEIAQDITRAFFQQLTAETRGGALPDGRFRDWLLGRLNTFLAGDWRELAEGETTAVAPSLEDLEQRNRDDLTAAGSPEQAFQRGFALEVLARGFKRLQSEAGQTGHLDMYEALEPYLAHDPLPGQYEEIGRRLAIRPLALVLALKRLRQRFRELVQQELMGTVASPEQLDAEQRALFAAMGGGR